LFVFEVDSDAARAWVGGVEHFSLGAAPAADSDCKIEDGVGTIAFSVGSKPLSAISIPIHWRIDVKRALREPVNRSDHRSGCTHPEHSAI
jgi:hypothetical protein